MQKGDNMPKIDFECIEGDTIYLACFSKDNKGEYSIYQLKVTREVVEGNGLDDAFLYETSGFEEDKNADYCTCEPHFEMPNTSLCSMCHKSLK